jgi:hypothetical protein
MMPLNVDQFDFLDHPKQVSHVHGEMHEWTRKMRGE